MISFLKKWIVKGSFVIECINWKLNVIWWNWINFFCYFIPTENSTLIHLHVVFEEEQIHKTCMWWWKQPEHGPVLCLQKILLLSDLHWTLENLLKLSGGAVYIYIYISGLKRGATHIEDAEEESDWEQQWDSRAFGDKNQYITIYDCTILKRLKRTFHLQTPKASGAFSFISNGWFCT